VFRPAEFDVTDPARAADHVRRHPFGVLVSGGTGGLRGTHLPFLLGPGGARDAFPPTLLSHGSARNPQLRALADGDEVLAVVPGPEAYVSASWYEAEPDVPTWNYTAVHVSGRYERLDRDAAAALLDATVTAFEDDRGAPGWDLGVLDPALVDGLARGVIAFAVHVDEVRAAAKLSQDKLPRDVALVRRGLAGRDAGGRDVVAEMERHAVRGRAAGEPA
jgi:transcriptional regulator